jgi:uncharacterized protein YndB with AHSA1/START domain
MDPMHEVASKKKNQPAPSQVVFEALTDPDRGPHRQWLSIRSSEVRPVVLESEAPRLVVWSSLWEERPDARVRFDLTPSASGYDTDLRWTLLLDDPFPDESTVRALRHRLNQLINANLRYSFGQ